MEWYLKVLKQYADFGGRARRKEYWMFFLFNVIICVVFEVLAAMIGKFFGFVLVLYSLGVLIPGLAVSIRRLHDVGKSGWWLLIAFIPIIGAIWLLVLMVTDSQPGNNQWGANPKEA